MRWKRGNRLKLVGEAQAPPRTREIFDEVRHSLGVPGVPVLYQAYAAWPEFLELHWQAFRPAIQSRQFFLLGARIAAESYTRAHNYFDVRGVAARELQHDAMAGLSFTQVLDYFQYLDPLLLLIAAGQMQAFEGPVGTEGIAAEAAQHPTFQVSPRLLDNDHATTALQRIWDERRRLLDLAFISDEHRALACWPSFYREYWCTLKELMQSPLFSDTQYRINESAWSLAHELPVRVETGVTQLIEAGMSDEQMSSLARINEAFVQSLSGLVLDVTFARVAYEGGTHRESCAPKAEPAQTEPAGSSTHAA